VILVDTSVWIDHFRSCSLALSEALERGEILTHPFVIGEIACGNLRRRNEVLDLLFALPQSTMATDEEVLHFIGNHQLMGKGIGYVDGHLLAAAFLTGGALLWTHDKSLLAAAVDLRLAFKP